MVWGTTNGSNRYSTDYLDRYVHEATERVMRAGVNGERPDPQDVQVAILGRLSRALAPQRRRRDVAVEVTLKGSAIGAIATALGAALLGLLGGG